MQNFNTQILIHDLFIGNYSGSGKVFILGNVNGTFCVDELIVGVTGNFSGKIVARSLVVEGKIQADVETEKIHIKSKGKLKGDLIYRNLIIEDGAFLNSNKVVKMSDKESIKKFKLI